MRDHAYADLQERFALSITQSMKLQDRVRELESTNSHLQKLCEEQKGEIERLKKELEHTYSHQTVRFILAAVDHRDAEIARIGKDLMEMIEIKNKAESQLATQTDRMKVMREALELAYHSGCRCQLSREGTPLCETCYKVRQALNQRI